MKVGDVVVLKSGGPRMTIAQMPDPYGFVICCWFDKNNESVSESFASAVMLRPADKELFRAGLKSDLKEDLKKSIWYIQRELTRIEAAEAKPKLEGDT